MTTRKATKAKAAQTEVKETPVKVGDRILNDKSINLKTLAKNAKSKASLVRDLLGRGFSVNEVHKALTRGNIYPNMRYQHVRNISTQTLTS